MLLGSLLGSSLGSLGLDDLGGLLNGLVLLDDLGSSGLLGRSRSEERRVGKECRL